MAARGKHPCEDATEGSSKRHAPATPDTGNASDLFTLGVCHEDGKGVTKDEKKAAKLYREAADLGYARAVFRLGLCYLSGIGVRKNRKKAFELFQKAAGM